MIQLTDFYMLRFLKPKIVTTDSAMEYALVTDLKCAEHYPTRGTRLTPLAITVDRPTDDDILETQYSDFVVTDVAKRAMTDAHLTGFSFEPALVTGKAVREVGYWEVHVRGFAGFMDPAYVQGVQICQKCGRVRYDTTGTFADAIAGWKWDGSDFFTFWPYHNAKLMSRRFVEAIKSRGIRGFRVQSAAERLSKGATPQRPDIALTSEQQSRLAADADYRALVLDRSPQCLQR